MLGLESSRVVAKQFELDLFPDEPWGGHSPRALTRARSGLFLRQEPPRHEVETDPLQLMLPLWEKDDEGKRGPGQDGGASLLLPRCSRGTRAREKPFWEVL